MKLQQLTAIAAVGISVLVAGGLVAAQDRFTLQSPNGIAFAEFKGYEAWQMISRVGQKAPQRAALRGHGAGRLERGFIHGEGLEAVSKHQWTGIRDVPI
jgi:hypothetical protein